MSATRQDVLPPPTPPGRATAARRTAEVPPAADRRRILIVEDETDLAELISYNLSRHGFDTDTAADGVAAIDATRRDVPDLIVLDVMLPRKSGLEVARELRADPRTAHVPILMLTARAEEADQIAGLEVGADDYVTKPFSVKVLVARVEAILRRAATASPEDDAEPERVAFGPLAADRAQHEIRLEGQLLHLTLTEFKLLLTLMEHPNRVLTRQDLITSAMGPGITVTARTIDVHVAAIRKKLGEHGAMIRTVRGVGYRLVEHGEDDI